MAACRITRREAADRGATMRLPLACLLVVALAATLLPSDAPAMQPKAIGRLGFDGVSSMVHSPMGHLIAVTTGQGHIQVIDATTGGPVVLLMDAGQAPAFSRDEKALASTGRDGTEWYIRLWDIESGRETARLAAQANTLAFSPSGASLASGSLLPGGGDITLWNVDTRKKTATLVGHDRGVGSLAFSPDGSILASGSGDGMVKLWDMGARREVATLPGHTGGLECVTFSADGSILASGSYDATVRLWDVESGREISTLTGHGGGVHSVAFSPDGRTLVTGSDDHTTMLWDVASARRTMTLEGHDGRVIMVAFTPNGHAVVSGRAVNDWSETTDDAIRLWDVASGRQVDSFGGPMTLVRALAFSPDGEIVATSAGSLAEEVTLWNVASGRRVGALAGGASSLAFSPEGTIVAAGGRSGTTLWDVASRQLAATLAGQGSPAFRPDGAMLATAGGEIIALWDVASWQRVATIAAHPEGSFELAFSPNGTTLAGSGRDYTIRLWDVAVAAGAARAHGADVPLLTEVARLQGHTDSVLDLDFSSDGRLLASAGRDMTTKLWDVVAHRKVASLDAGGRSRAVAFSPNGRVVASVGEGTNTRLWDVASLRRIATVGGHANSFVYTLAFSPDGTLLASGRYGVLLWRVADTAVVTATAVDPRGKADATWARVKQAALTADETVVLPNYPNPFNPETWVPFDLSENANVTVSVYDAEGRIVRRLDLGAYPAGTYRTRGRAAHWDGRNEQGEVVSSGVYFAELRAGDYRSTRRIALRK